MDTFIEAYNVPKRNHSEIENLNRPITRKEVELLVKPSPKTKAQDETALLVNYDKHSKKI